jgi:hypothetical protein
MGEKNVHTEIITILSEQRWNAHDSNRSSGMRDAGVFVHGSWDILQLMGLLLYNVFGALPHEI